MLTLSGTEYYLLGVIVAALVLIVSNRVAPDLIAMLVLLALGLREVVTPAQALSGFSSPAVITIVGLFVITAALERNGVIHRLSDYLAHLSGQTEARMILVTMGAGALLSLLMNNIAAGAVLLPAILRMAQQAEVRPSKLLIPLAFGTLVGGMATLFTTANILMSAFLQERGQRPLTMLDFLLTGGIVALAGMVYLVLLGRRLLPDRESPVSTARRMEVTPDLHTTYQLTERLWEGYVLPSSSLVGTTLARSQIGATLGITVLSIWRGEEARTALTPNEQISAHDVLLVLGREERVRRLEEADVRIGPTSQDIQALTIEAMQPTEVIIAPRSPVIGRTLTDLRFHSKYGLRAVAIWRGGRSYRTDVGKMPLQAGDALLMIGTLANVQALAQEPGYIVPAAPRMQVPRRRGLWATIIAAVAIGVSMLGLVSTPEAMLAGAVVLVLTRCIRMDEFYGAVEWRIVFLIAGMTPLSVAMQETGLATRFGDGVVTAFTPLGPLGLIAGLYLLTFLLVQVFGGQVTALVVGPLAISAALQAGVNPVAMAVAISIACSASFLTPVAHPVNMLMMNPGGYTPRDFLRVGSGMALVCFLALLIVMPILWQL